LAGVDDVQVNSKILRSHQFSFSWSGHGIRPVWVFISWALLRLPIVASSGPSGAWTTVAPTDPEAAEL
jgi:hypothetical protein